MNKIITDHITNSKRKSKKSLELMIKHFGKELKHIRHSN